MQVIGTNAQAIEGPADGGRPGLPSGMRRLARLALSGSKLLLSGGLMHIIPSSAHGRAERGVDAKIPRREECDGIVPL